MTGLCSFVKTADRKEIMPKLKPMLLFCRSKFEDNVTRKSGNAGHSRCGPNQGNTSRDHRESSSKSLVLTWGTKDSVRETIDPIVEFNFLDLRR